jgi:hypothetical protein
MFLHIVLARFRTDADPADLQAFLDDAPGALASAPFRIRALGPDLNLGITSSADWGYVAEVENPDDLRAWEEAPEHVALRDRMLRIRDSVLNVQLPVAD